MDSAENFLLQGHDNILDTRDKSVGMSQKKMNLFYGKYTMDSFVDDVMIRKGVNLRKESFDILKNWSHPISVPLINFYSESTNMGRLIVSPVDDTFTEWLEYKGVHILFDEDGRMSKLFRDFIIELCDMVQSLHLNDIVMLKGIQKEDLYVKIYASGASKVLVLLTEVKKSYHQGHEMQKNWKSIQELIDWCCKDSVQLHSDSKWFKKFIGEPTFSVTKLRQYPDDWDYKTKGEYLMALKSSMRSNIKNELRFIDVSWPEQIPVQLNQIIEESKVKGFIYNPPIRIDYLSMLWDSYKHFGKMRLYRMFANHQDFLKEVELWTPYIWMKLYEKLDGHNFFLALLIS